MFSKEKIARIGLLIFALIGIYGIIETINVDYYYTSGLTITWSKYVVYTVSFLFVSCLPLCFKMKYNTLISSIVFSAGVIYLLYLLDGLSIENDWFAPLALPMALIILAQLWTFWLLLKFLKFNKWFVSAIFVLIFGIVTGTTAVHYTSMYLGKFSMSMLSMNAEVIAYSAGIGVLFIAIGIIAKVINGLKKGRASNNLS